VRINDKFNANRKEVRSPNGTRLRFCSHRNRIARIHTIIRALLVERLQSVPEYHSDHSIARDYCYGDRTGVAGLVPSKWRTSNTSEGSLCLMSTTNQRKELGSNVKRLGFWSALLTAVVAAIFFAAGIFTPARSGPFCVASCIAYPYVGGLATFIPADYIWMYPGFLLAPLFVVLMACIHHYASDDKKIFGQIGLSFALIYAAVITIDYFIQFVVVEPSIVRGESAGLSLFTQYNPHGIFIGLGLGYLMMSVSFLFAAPLFGRGRLERTIRWLYVSSFALAVSALLGLSLLRYDITRLR
jgi:hypothetical protein